MKKAIGRLVSASICGMAALTMLGGCESAAPLEAVASTGFLSDYSRLEPISSTSYRYANPKYSLANYSRFIINPVEVYFEDRAKADVGSWDELEKLRAYMRRAVINTLEPRYTATAAQNAVEPGSRVFGPRVAIVRIALTHVRRGSVLKLGGVSMEAELLDPQTGEQIGALVEKQGKRRPFGGFSAWDDARAAMDEWAKRFFNRLEEARGR
ncbi:MAG: DUF3313 domain-containing protein [Planctomycetota bacterium]|jgi:hypothetical protein